MTAGPRVRTALRPLAAVVCLRTGTSNLHAASSVRWTVCYSDTPSPAALAKYDVVVLDPVRHPPLALMQARKRTLLAYLSLTEMDASHRAMPDVEAAGIALSAHPEWTDARFLDFRRPEWRRLVLDRLVPEALAAGFNGMFLDTLDDAAYLESVDGERYAGMQAAASELVTAIRRRYPHIVLMVNRGFALMPAIATSIDIVLGESVVTTFAPATAGAPGTSDPGTPAGRSYTWRSDDDIAWQVNALQEAQRLNPRLQVFTLDYWDPSDADGIRRIYREQRARGFSPYVSTRALDTLVEEPR